MSSVTKPIMLNETGEQIVQKLAEVAESNKSYEMLLNTKADKVDVSAPFNFKGDTTYASLPTSGNAINDTYYCSDKKCRYTWNGEGWYQSSMNEVDYTDELAKMEADLAEVDSKLSSEIADVEETLDNVILAIGTPICECSLGGIGDSGEELNINSAVRTTKIEVLKDDIFITLESGYKIKKVYYDSNNAYLGTEDFTENPSDIYRHDLPFADSYYVAFVVAHTTEKSYENADELNNAFKAYYRTGLVTDVKLQRKLQSSKIPNFSVALGAIDGSGKEVALNSAVRTTKIAILNDIVITLESGYKLKKVYYDSNNAYLGTEDFSEHPTNVMKSNLTYSTAYYVAFVVCHVSNKSYENADELGNALSVKYYRNKVKVASKDAFYVEKLNADYVCDGYMDEVEIQEAINELSYGGTIELSSGTFYIDTFDEENVAIKFPCTDAEYTYSLIGQGGFCILNPNGAGNTRIKLSQSCYTNLDSTKQYTIIGGTDFDKYVSTGIIMDNFTVQLPDNQKKVICIDLSYFGRCELNRVECEGSEVVGTPRVAVEGCIGIRMLNGSNYGRQNNFVSCGCNKFYEAWQVGGEHTIMVNCSAIFNVYGYTFGNYEYDMAFIHPITLINCCDERGINLPLFKTSGFYTDTQQAVSIQNINLIDFNVERNASVTPSGILGNTAVIEDEDAFGGTITFTMLEHAKGLKNSVDTPFFMNNGGKNFVVRNIAHALKGSTAERQSYGANNGQQYFDTDLNKMLIYLGSNWVDMLGNVV